MKTIIKLYCLLFVFISVAANTNTAVAQTTYQLTGTVADSVTKQPLGYITINVKSSDDIAIKATLSKPNGQFSLDGLNAGKYKLAIVAVGYQPKYMAFELTNKSLQLEAIYLAENIKGLKEVTITGDRPIVKQQADRITYDLQADPESKSSNVLNMIRKVPFLSLDADNNVLLKGNNSFKVLINGKPSSMADNNLKAVLQSMPASTIKSIEVITNPPARYDAEGMAGVINIITNKKVDNGFKGTLNANENLPVGGPALGTSFSLKQGKFGATGYGGASYNKQPGTGYLNTRATFGQSTSNLVQSGNDKATGRNGYFGTELSYEIDSLKLLSGQFNISGNHDNRHSDQSTLVTAPATILQQYSLQSLNISDGNGFDAGLNYQLGFKADKSKLLTLSYSYNNYNNDQLNDINLFNTINYSVPNYKQDNHTGNREQTLQADYVQQVKKLYIEGGVKAILRNNQSKFNYLQQDSITGAYDIYTPFSDAFNYKQDVFGAYNSYRLNLATWSFSGGVRMEETVVKANFLSTASIVDQNYFNVIPTIAINKEFKDRSSISFGFNQRIKRPSIRRLNPFVDRSNPNFESTGNPNLRPVISNNLQLGYNGSGKLSVTTALSYSFLNNIDLRIFTVDTTTNITYTTYKNTGKASRLGLDYNMRYPITNSWNVSVNGNMEYFEIEGLVGTQVIHNYLLGGSVSAATGYRFDKGWMVNANASYLSRRVTELQGTGNSAFRTSVSVNKDLIKNKLSMSAFVNNPFTRFRDNTTNTKGPDFVQVNTTYEYFRSFGVSLNYNFGQLKSEVKKGARGINNDDVSN
ncbi:TonB-dependent receptor [Inquilinus sp. KBS0705]|nr:TonB-dependent receptor [Inquilinus sp. KBS0705]